MGSSVSQSDLDGSTALTACKRPACISASSEAFAHVDDEPMVCGDEPIGPVAPFPPNHATSDTKLGDPLLDAAAAEWLHNIACSPPEAKKHGPDKENLPVASRSPVSYTPDVGYFDHADPSARVVGGGTDSCATGASKKSNEAGGKATAKHTKKQANPSSSSKTRHAQSDPFETSTTSLGDSQSGCQSL